jgi:hypothetical protein
MLTFPVSNEFPTHKTVRSCGVIGRHTLFLNNTYRQELAVVMPRDQRKRETTTPLLIEAFSHVIRHCIWASTAALLAADMLH